MTNYMWHCQGNTQQCLSEKQHSNQTRRTKKSKAADTAAAQMLSKDLISMPCIPAHPKAISSHSALAKTAASLFHWPLPCFNRSLLSFQPSCLTEVSGGVLSITQPTSRWFSTPADREGLPESSIDCHFLTLHPCGSL